MKFTKPALSNKDHLQLLRNRGLIVDDEENLTAALNQIGYFRLSGYMFPFQSRDGDHTFHAGVSSTAILRHYAFDKKLRIILLESIESLEVALRAEVCNRTSIEWGSHWYIDKHYFNNPDWHNDLVNSVNKSVDKGNEQFIRSYRNKYDTPSLPPIWMAMEVISFGELSSMYDNLKDGDVKKLVAGKFGVHDAFLSSWLKSINFVRNCCAHHNRLWNRRIPLKPILPRRAKYRVLNYLDDQTDKQLFGILSCMLYLLKTIGEDGDLRNNIKSLFDQYPEINKSYMGFHPAWADEPIWQ